MVTLIPLLFYAPVRPRVCPLPALGSDAERSYPPISPCILQTTPTTSNATKLTLYEDCAKTSHSVQSETKTENVTGSDWEDADSPRYSERVPMHVKNESQLQDKLKTQHRQSLVSKLRWAQEAVHNRKEVPVSILPLALTCPLIIVPQILRQMNTR